MADTVTYRTLKMRITPSSGLDEDRGPLWLMEQILAIKENLAVGEIRYPQDLNISIHEEHPQALDVHIIYHVDDKTNLDKILDLNASESLGLNIKALAEVIADDVLREADMRELTEADMREADRQLPDDDDAELSTSLWRITMWSDRAGAFAVNVAKRYAETKEEAKAMINHGKIL